MISDFDSQRYLLICFQIASVFIVGELTSRTLAKRLTTLANRPETLANESLAKRLVGETTAIPNNRPYSYSQYRTRTSLQWRLRRIRTSIQLSCSFGTVGSLHVDAFRQRLLQLRYMRQRLQMVFPLLGELSFLVNTRSFITWPHCRQFEIHRFLWHY